MILKDKCHSQIRFSSTTSYYDDDSLQYPRPDKVIRKRLTDAAAEYKRQYFIEAEETEETISGDETAAPEENNEKMAASNQSWLAWKTFIRGAGWCVANLGQHLAPKQIELENLATFQIEDNSKAFPTVI